MKKLKPSIVNRNSEARSHWARVLKDFQQSGLSGAAYCRSENLYYPTFAKWRQKLLGPVRTLGKRKPSPALFSKVERVTESEPLLESLQIRFPNGVLVNVQGSASPNWLLEIGGLK
jgi:hypothetical protein